MLHTTLGQFVSMVSGIVVATLALALVWSALESVFPKLKGCFARLD